MRMQSNIVGVKRLIVEFLINDFLQRQTIRHRSEHSATIPALTRSKTVTLHRSHWEESSNTKYVLFQQRMSHKNASRGKNIGASGNHISTC